MKVTFASYEHSTIGFPGVILRWCAENGKMERLGRVVVNGIIQKTPWDFGTQNTAIECRIDQELKRFDEWVRNNYGEDVSVQG